MKTRIIIAIALSIALTTIAHAQISLTGLTYSENFDSMGTNNPTLTPPGWFVGAVALATNGTPVAGTTVISTNGQQITGTNYNFGVAGTSSITNRALGSIPALSANRVTEVRLVNNTGYTITALYLSYDGEQWRDGGATGITNTLVMYFSTDGANFVPMGPFLTFNAPQAGSTASALDGHAATNRVAGIFGIFPTNILSGVTFYLRWLDARMSGPGAGLAIDNFNLIVDTTARISASPTNLVFSSQSVGTTSSISSVTITNVGTTTLSITNVNFSSGNAADFIVTNNSCTTLAAGTGCSIGVAFKPTAGGVRSTVMNIFNNTPVNPATITVSGTGVVAVVGTTNSWTDGSDKWETAGDWTLGTPSITNAATVITNATTETVSIDATTAGSFPGSLTISNFTITAPTGSTNTLLVASPGTNTPLRINNGCRVGNGGALVVTNSALDLTHSSFTTDGLLVDGSASILDSLLLTTNADILVGTTNGANGQLIFSNSTIFAQGMTVGYEKNSTGTLHMASGTLTLLNGHYGAHFYIGGADGFTNAFGSFWLDGGSVDAFAASAVLVGGAGGGQMTMSNGYLRAFNISVSSGNLSQPGTFTLAGGTTEASYFYIGTNPNATGTVWVTGGTLLNTNSDSLFYVGGTGYGRLVISNGDVRVNHLAVAHGANGVLETYGGSLTVLSSNSLILGDSIGVSASMSLSDTYLDATNASITVCAAQNTLGSLDLINSSGVARSVTVGAQSGSTGSLTMQSSVLSVLSSLGVGSSGAGSLTVTDSTLSCDAMSLASSTGGTAQTDVKKSVLQVLSSLDLGSGANASASFGVSDKSQVLCTLMQLATATNSQASMNVSGSSTVSCSVVEFSTSQGSKSTIDIVDSVANILSNLSLATADNSTSTVSMASSQLSMAGGIWSIGAPGVASVTIGRSSSQIGGSSVSRAKAVYIGVGIRGSGKLVISNGTMEVYSIMALGNCDFSAPGAVDLEGGSLYITNATLTGTLDIRNGWVLMNSGTLVVDRFVMTNSCAQFYRNGGTVIVNGQTLLDPNLDADGDGMPNGWESAHGFDPLNPADASADADGDGYTNLQEYQNGTDPHLAGEFHITAIAQETNNIRVTWTTFGSGSLGYMLRRAATPTGEYADLNPYISGVGFVLSTTNAVDLGGVTNGTAQFYRVDRLPSNFASDNAGDVAYNTGWSNFSGGGHGFGPWTLTSSGSAGYFTGTSTNNASGTGPGIDTGGRSWGIYANSGGLTAAFRTFTAMSSGQTFAVSMDNGFIDAGQSVGFTLRSGGPTSGPGDYNANALFEFLFLGGTNNYAIVDNAGFNYTSIPFTGTGLKLRFKLTGGNTYRLQVTDNATGATNTITGTMSSSSAIDNICIFNRNAGAGYTNEVFFNNLRLADAP